MTDLVLLEVATGIATLTLNRPEKRNAMNDEMRTQFIISLERVAADTAIRALVLTGAGKGFCAGGDISGMSAPWWTSSRRKVSPFVRLPFSPTAKPPPSSSANSGWTLRRMVSPVVE